MGWVGPGLLGTLLILISFLFSGCEDPASTHGSHGYTVFAP